MELFHLLLSSLCFEHLATPSLPYNLSQSNLNLDNGIDATAAEDSTEGRDKLVVFHPFKNVLTEISTVFTAISTTLSREFISAAGISTATLPTGTSTDTVAASSSLATSKS